MNYNSELHDLAKQSKWMHFWSRYRELSKDASGNPVPASMQVAAKEYKRYQKMKNNPALIPPTTLPLLLAALVGYVIAKRS